MPMTYLIVSGWLSTASSPQSLPQTTAAAVSASENSSRLPKLRSFRSIDTSAAVRPRRSNRGTIGQPGSQPRGHMNPLSTGSKASPGASSSSGAVSLVKVRGPLLSLLYAGADLLINRCAVMLVQLGAAAVLSARQKTGRSAAVSSAPPHDRRDLHSRRECPASMQPRQAGQEHGNQSDMDAVAGSHVGSQRRERLPTTGGRVRTGSWRSCQLADRSGRR